MTREELKEYIDTLEQEPKEPKTGEWIKQSDDYCDWYECSEC
jgi:hypothetical protein